MWSARKSVLRLCSANADWCGVHSLVFPCREFIRRPRVRTMDGDVIGAFHAPAYSECCAMLLQFIRILNTNKSCDTVALSMELFEIKQHILHHRHHSQSKHTKNWLFLYMMEQISDGQFLCACPSESTIRSKIWGETKVCVLHACFRSPLCNPSGHCDSWSRYCALS